MTTFVWVDSWQQQCCGGDFRVGSTVEWSVVRNDDVIEWAIQLLGEEWGRKIEYREEHHDYKDPDLTLSGVVRSIRVVTCDRVLGTTKGPGPSQAMIAVPGSGRLRAVEVADPWEPEPRVEDHSTTFDGWLVELEVNHVASLIRGLGRA